MKSIFLICISLFIISCCKKEDPKSLIDNNLIGTWRIDSITNYSNNYSNYPQMDSWNKTNKSIVLEFSSEFKIGSVEPYSYSMSGTYFISEINGTIKIKIEEVIDYLNRPESKWQPLCLKNLNNSIQYKLEGNNMKLYTNNNEFVINLKKQ
jgi:hypothetical protein